MGLTYNKEFKPKDRRIMPTGPRDRQIKQIAQVSNSDQSLLIEELRTQINKLQEQLEKKSDANVGYTSEQVDEEIIKAVKFETLSLRTQHEIEKNKLQNKIESLEETLQQFKNNQNNNNSLTEERILSIISEATKNTSLNSDLSMSGGRPQMETVFVDPIEKETNLEKHFEVEETSTDSKIQLDDKVNKLKELLGKLPANKS